MGQRLIIKNRIINPITKHQSDANVIYYHWSAYTESSLIELEDFVTNPRSQGCPRFQSGEELANSVGKINAC